MNSGASLRGAAGKECVFFPSLDKAERYPVNGPRAGRLSFKLSSTMQSVARGSDGGELACEAGLDEDERFRVTMRSGSGRQRRAAR